MKAGSMQRKTQTRRSFKVSQFVASPFTDRQAGGTYTFMVLVTCTTLIALGNTLFAPAQQTLKINYLRQHKVAGQQLIRAGMTVLEANPQIKAGDYRYELASGTIQMIVVRSGTTVNAEVTGIPRESAIVTGPITTAKITAEVDKNKLSIRKIEFTRQITVPRSKLEGSK